MRASERYERHAQFCEQLAEEYRRDAENALRDFCPETAARTYADFMAKVERYLDNAAYYHEHARRMQ